MFASVRMMNKDSLMISLYGPNRDDPQFCAELEKHVRFVLKILSSEGIGI